MTEKKRPGVMFYFDARPSLRRLSLEEKGLLFEGMLDYAQFEEEPEFDGMLGVAWDFIRPRIDQDGERYEEIRESRRRAAQKRWEIVQEHTPAYTPVQEDANASDALQREALQQDAVQEEALQMDAVQDIPQETPDEPPVQEESWWENVLEDANAFFAEQTVPTTTPTTASASTTYSTPTSTPTSTLNQAKPKPRPGPPAAGPAQAQARAEMEWEDLRRRKLELLSGMIGQNA